MIMVVLRTIDFNIQMKKLSIFISTLLLVGWGAFAASDVTLTVTGRINEGTCTLDLNNSSITLADIDSSNTYLNSQTPTKSQEVVLNITNCSPGAASHKPALLFSGNINNQMWRDTNIGGGGNDAGNAYGILINEKLTSSLVCEATNGKSILAGHCDLGAEGELLTNKTIKLDVGYGKSDSIGVNTGSVKSSIQISFVYH